MKELIKKITKLSKLEKRFFADTIFDSGEDAVTQLLATLQRFEPEQREAFIRAIPYEHGLWIKDHLEKSAAADDKIVAKVEKMIAAALKTVPVKVKKAERNMAAISKKVINNRKLLRTGFAELDNVISDQQRGRPQPLVQKPYPKNAVVVELPKPDRSTLVNNSLYDCVAARKSRRKFNEHPLTVNELSYLLWATQGVKRISDDRRQSNRTVPSGGAMHPFETCIAVNNVDGVKPGLYRYQAADHTLVFLHEIKDQKDAIDRACFGQKFVGYCAATFFWIAIPYKSEWRYVTEAAKLILLDAGHVCQNFYLACESIGCGTCAIGAYDQDKIDKLLKLDGNNELVVYIAPVGKV